jgi:4-hydroxy-tetrahydrodipicolinate synthase
LSRSKTDPFHPHGIIVPMVTPFKGNDMDEVDFEAIAKLTRYVIDNGVNAVMVNGTSGEFLLQSRKERKEVVKAVVKEASGRIPVIAGVSEASTMNAVELARDAEKDRADALIATGPIYYKTTPEGLFDHFQTIMNKVELPLMIYNIPSWLGYGVPPEIVKKLALKNPGKLCGVKFTTDDLEQFLEYLRVLGELIPITIGSDSLLLSGLELGAAGGTVGSANALPKETSQIYNHHINREYPKASGLQKKIDSFTVTMGLGCFPAGLKEGLKFLGIDCGDVRPPLVPLTVEEKKKVRRSLAWKKRELDV